MLNVLLSGVWGEVINWRKRYTQLENVICFRKGGGNTGDLFLSSCDLEVNCCREYENGVCDISIFFVLLPFACFYETNCLWTHFSRLDRLQIQNVQWSLFYVLISIFTDLLAFNY